MAPPNKQDLFLEEVFSSQEKHFLWLKSLSYLEYIGYRKMVKSLSYDEMGKDTFQHLSDEIQHSFMLRRLADSILDPEACYSSEGGKSEVIRGIPARLPQGMASAGMTGIVLNRISQISENYFQTLDSKIGEWITDLSGAENHHLSYLWVSYIIEKRAMKVYPHYFSKLDSSPLKTTIQKIIKDESEHLSYLENYIQKISKKYLNHSSDLFVLEDRFFSHYLEEMQSCF